MSFICVYIHLVWSTKDWAPFLSSKELRKKVWTHIFENAKEKDIFIDTIGGYNDHCHCLISLRGNQSIENVMQLIKGESSFWINKNKLTTSRFGWQEEFFAVSVSESIVPKVRNYIRNQEEHHLVKSSSDEFNEFLNALGFQRFVDGTIGRKELGNPNKSE